MELCRLPSLRVYTTTTTTTTTTVVPSSAISLTFLTSVYCITTTTPLHRHSISVTPPTAQPSPSHPSTILPTTPPLIPPPPPQLTPQHRHHFRHHHHHHHHHHHDNNVQYHMKITIESTIIRPITTFMIMMIGIVMNVEVK
ncbi:hypothetical protein E2C01_067039 [Portunus trituberculatus]|uniref:Uncharacterized protein n=1 Tax=Portunus trituberculatus TaxID=210409 RepID=A0A5B7HTZ2_PORTR|nr:hypothetical protein [Portunus trituberculatus]